MSDLRADNLAGASILATGGCGYIGSHVALDLLQAGADVVALDDLSNSKPVALQRVARLTNRAAELVVGDVRDRDLLARLFAKHRFDAVVHFAGLKAVGESTQFPGRYYDVNLGGSIALFEAMAAADCRIAVFSSSATVYGAPETMPIDENAPPAPVSPYGRSKRMVEQTLEDIAGADPSWTALCLRYFNPVGAHPSGEIGEDPAGEPNNLFPYIAQVAAGRRERLRVFGDDYPTPDGTGVRDYIHVCDLSAGHLAALRYALGARDSGQPAGFQVFNLGAGRGYSVLETLDAWKRAIGRPVPREVAPRRPGDVAVCYADPGRAERLLGWRAERDLDAMCADHWRWQQQNRSGYDGAQS